MAGARTRPFDVADHLNTPEEVAAYLDAVLEEGDDKLLLVALRNVVKSEGFTKVARGAGLRRETLYQSFSEDGNPLHSGRRSQLGMRLRTTGEKRSSDSSTLESPVGITFGVPAQRRFPGRYTT